jgi:hypothetical protein
MDTLQALAAALGCGAGEFFATNPSLRPVVSPPNLGMEPGATRPHVRAAEKGGLA